MIQGPGALLHQVFKGPGALLHQVIKGPGALLHQVIKGPGGMLHQLIKGPGALLHQVIKGPGGPLHRGLQVWVVPVWAGVLSDRLGKDRPLWLLENLSFGQRGTHKGPRYGAGAGAGQGPVDQGGAGPGYRAGRQLNSGGGQGADGSGVWQRVSGFSVLDHHLLIGLYGPLLNEGPLR